MKDPTPSLIRDQTELLLFKKTFGSNTPEYLLSKENTRWKLCDSQTLYNKLKEGKYLSYSYEYFYKNSFRNKVKLLPGTLRAFSIARGIYYTNYNQLLGKK